VSLEISWYLRFHRGDTITFLVGDNAMGQVEHALYIETGWKFSASPVAEDSGGLRVVMTRKKARG
jgi:hypothetical protein